jgi:hypothetical protein
MYNFISTFEELNKLYEEFTPEAEKKEVENEEVVEEACEEKLTEAAEDEIIEDEPLVDEEPVEEPVAEEEPRQVICECDKCGALVIMAEADIVVDEESDLVNVEDECQFCEEANGFKIVGVVAPYEAVEEAEEDTIEVVEDEEPVEEGFFGVDIPVTANVNVKADGNSVPVLNGSI